MQRCKSLLPHNCATIKTVKYIDKNGVSNYIEQLKYERNFSVLLGCSKKTHVTFQDPHYGCTFRRIVLDLAYAMTFIVIEETPRHAKVK